ncbi:hypothetical protein AU255_07310 [Methyloprofundus sedimenti]|uniref:Uncharacterized protein n=1 Tax=Methyloprofundus sedimenti TaxID=1420851 RepID=A0A1V8M7V6_9GAMM|nr:hypothetical protein [Methyloprofundus sedimenti]OQK17664.1 hypothetical protein AU255_07310 [Methyloprofundus sedimenti]
MQKKTRAVVQNTESIISLGKSKRLAAIRKSQEIPPENLSHQLKPCANKREEHISLARKLITQKIAKIKSTLPLGKQNKLFDLRYGSEQKLNQLGLQQLYTLLSISQELAKEIREVKYLEIN